MARNLEALEHTTQASILIKARTRYYRLNRYLSRTGIVEESECRCGIDGETVCHVLCVYPSWAVRRKTLQAVDSDGWGDVCTYWADGGSVETQTQETYWMKREMIGNPT